MQQLSLSSFHPTPFKIPLNDKKIIALEGLDGTGKSALARQLIEILGGEATVIHIAYSQDKVAPISKETFFEQANVSDEPVTRTFVRIIYSTRQYDRLGNTHNPAFEYQWDMVRREAQLDLLKS
jgi:thymidylate kinase